jgi:hypothetical protein
LSLPGILHVLAAQSWPAPAGRTAPQIDIAAWRRDGLVVAPVTVPAEVLARMRDALDRLLERSAGIAPESLVCPHIPGGQRHPPDEAAEWFEFATQPWLLDLVEQVLGPDIILWGSQVFCKPAFTGREVPWHQDGRYWPIRPLATCSAWIALDDVSAENGCMRFIPGSHAAGRLVEHRDAPHASRVLGLEAKPDAFDAGAARDDVLAAGQLSLHDVFLIHGSGPNRSPRRRAGFVVRYMPATSRFERTPGDHQPQAGVSFSLGRRPIWLTRGRDRAGNDFVTGHGEDFGLVPRLSDDD